MKRTVIFSIIILLIAGLAAGANRIAGGILDAQLAPLLTRVLGLPVTLAPIKANLLQLKASSAKLVMGPADNPSVVATDVVVTISLSALLEREIRLELASADDLVVNPSLWPSSGGPLPEDYLFLDPWLPNDLQFESGQYVFDDGSHYPLQQARWQRTSAGGATALWSEQRGDATRSISADLKSLQDLLQLAPISIAWTAAVDGEAASSIALNTTVQPGQDTAYEILANIEASGVNADIVATGKTPWTLPDRSKTSAKQVEPKKLLDLFASYRGSSKGEGNKTLLESRLPRLQLPGHQGSVTIDELRLGNEVGKDTAFSFSSSANGLQIRDLRSKGPTGVLAGQLGIDSGAQGWTVKVDATMSGREEDKSIAAQFVDSSWLWRTGRAQLDGSGDTWESLLNSLAGAVSLLGHHRGEVQTPVSIEAQLDTESDSFSLDRMTIKLGEGEFTGSAALSGTKRRTLTLDLKGDNLDLDFLFEEDGAAVQPGIAIPEYLGLVPSLDLDIALDVSNLEAPSLQLATARAKLHRTDKGGTLQLQATGKDTGTLDMEMAVDSPGSDPERVSLRATFNRLDLPAMFQQQVVLHSRSSGKIAFQSEAQGLTELFKAMQGTADMDIEFRPDNNWQRKANEREQLQFSGNSRFVIEKDRIMGIEFTDVDIDSIEQDITGSISVVAGRSPWLVADIKAPTLNVPALIALLPDSPEEADQANLLTLLQRMGAAKLTVDVDSLTVSDQPLSNMQLKVISAKDVFGIKQLDFTSFGSRFESTGNITWQGKSAKLEGSAKLENVDLDQFLISNPEEQHVPVSGTAQLSSEGTTVAELLGNLNGHIDLQASQPSASGSMRSRRNLSMVARRLPDGVHADISRLEWGASDLAGSIHYRRTTPASLDIELKSGNLSLLPWETTHTEAKPDKKAKGAETGIGSAARASANFVGRALLTPVRLLSESDEPKAGERMFSATPLPLDALNKMNVTFKGQMDSLESTALNAKDLKFDGTVASGTLNLKASSSEFSNGTADVTVTLDSLSQPPALKFETHFRDINKFSGKETYTQSGFISIDSVGTSPAELAAGATGLAYIELGPGTFDFAGFSIFTADLGSTVFRTLIPGIENRQPKLDCGVAVAVLQDGTGITPYGFSLRTDQANVLGRIEVDLETEALQMRLDSRSREGVGLSVGNVFSNAIRIRGTLADPTVVPATTAIAWRGWAAFMTAGLSVVGESVLKRVLASDNPCKSTKKLIKKELCPENALAASSPMVCPPD